MKPKKEKLVIVTAKIPQDIKETIVKTANDEERSVSQVVSRLLSSHPLLKQMAKRGVESVKPEPFAAI